MSALSFYRNRKKISRPFTVGPHAGAGHRNSLPAVFVGLLLSALFTFVAWNLYYQKFFTGLTLNDAMDYAGIARNIAEGRGFISQYLTPLSLVHHGVPQPDLWRAPLWPLALAGFQKIFGFIDEASAIGTGFFFVASSPLIFLLARNWFNNTVAAGSVLIYTLSPEMLSFSISGMTEPMSVFFMMLVFLVMALPGARSRFGDVLLGAVIGLFYLTRYNALLFLPLFALFRAFQKDGSKISTLLRIILGFALTTSPWLIRNTVLFGSPLFSLQKYEPVMFTKTFPDYLLYILPQKVDVLSFVRNNTPEVLEKVAASWQEFLSLAATPEFWGVSPVFLLLFILPVFFLDRKTSYYKMLITSLFAAQLAALLVIHFIPRLFLIFTPLLIITGLGSLWLALSSLTRSTTARRGRKYYFINFITLAVITVLSVSSYLSIPTTATGRERNLFPDALAAITSVTSDSDLVMTNEGHIVSWYGNRYAAKIPYSVEMIPEMEKISPAKALFISNRILWHMPEGDVSWKKLFYQHPEKIYDFELYKIFPDKSVLYIKTKEGHSN